MKFSFVIKPFSTSNFASASAVANVVTRSSCMVVVLVMLTREIPLQLFSSNEVRKLRDVGERFKV